MSLERDKVSLDRRPRILYKQLLKIKDHITQLIHSRNKEKS